MKYSFKTTLFKGVKYFVIFLIPLLVNQFVVSYPDVAQITIGAALVMLVNWLKTYVGLRLP
jgi:hypothetical protein